jgi:hypothetical protein
VLLILHRLWRLLLRLRRLLLGLWLILLLGIRLLFSILHVHPCLPLCC